MLAKSRRPVFLVVPEVVERTASVPRGRFACNTIRLQRQPTSRLDYLVAAEWWVVVTPWQAGEDSSGLIEPGIRRPSRRALRTSVRATTS